MRKKRRRQGKGEKESRWVGSRTQRVVAGHVYSELHNVYLHFVNILTEPEFKVMATEVWPLQLKGEGMLRRLQNTAGGW